MSGALKLRRLASGKGKRFTSFVKFPPAWAAKSLETYLIVNEDRGPKPTSFATAHVFHGCLRCLHERRLLSEHS